MGKRNKEEKTSGDTQKKRPQRDGKIINQPDTLIYAVRCVFGEHILHITLTHTLTLYKCRTGDLVVSARLHYIRPAFLDLFCPAPLLPHFLAIQCCYTSHLTTPEKNNHNNSANEKKNLISEYLIVFEFAKGNAACVVYVLRTNLCKSHILFSTTMNIWPMKKKKCCEIICEKR